MRTSSGARATLPMTQLQIRFAQFSFNIAMMEMEVECAALEAARAHEAPPPPPKPSSGLSWKPKLCSSSGEWSKSARGFRDQFVIETKTKVEFTE